jgi:VIT1/CCC1 family predicted Fe2+/Mn2+ transporter
MKKIVCTLIALHLFIFSGISTASAQSDDLIKSTQEDILLVVGAGAAGAVLGLSTLSFVDKPSQHISNIWTGAALGIIAGVVIVAYNSAQKGSEELQASKEFNSRERLAWHSQETEILTFREAQFGTQFFSMNF